MGIPSPLDTLNQQRKVGGASLPEAESGTRIAGLAKCLLGEGVEIETEGQVIVEGALGSRVTGATERLEHGLSRREIQRQVRGMPL